MSDYAQAFINHLQTLHDRDRGALAALRHGLAFEPGSYPKAYPYVERFVSNEWHERDARRTALYAVAGLFSKHPLHTSSSFASSLGTLFLNRGSQSIESRFIATLGADAGNMMEYLRPAISLLAADGIGLDYAKLLDDLSRWLNPSVDPGIRDQLKQRWARDFYRSAQAGNVSKPPSTP